MADSSEYVLREDKENTFFKAHMPDMPPSASKSSTRKSTVKALVHRAAHDVRQLFSGSPLGSGSAPGSSRKRSRAALENEDASVSSNEANAHVGPGGSIPGPAGSTRSKRARRKRAALDEAAFVSPPRVFGAPLGDIIPPSITKLVVFIREHALKADGLFRVSGTHEKIMQVRQLIEDGMTVDWTSIEDVHVHSGLLKMYLRELPNPLLTFEMYERFLSVMEEYEVATDGAAEDATAAATAAVIPKVTALVGELPSARRQLLRDIVRLLRDTAAWQKLNRMTPDNLARVFGPNVLWPRESLSMDLHHIKLINALVCLLIEHCETVFPKPLPPTPSKVAATAAKPLPPTPHRTPVRKAVPKRPPPSTPVAPPPSPAMPAPSPAGRARAAADGGGAAAVQRRRAAQRGFGSPAAFGKSSMGAQVAANRAYEELKKLVALEEQVTDSNLDEIPTGTLSLKVSAAELLQKARQVRTDMERRRAAGHQPTPPRKQLPRPPCNNADK